jgi:hypothetical protein
MHVRNQAVEKALKKSGLWLNFISDQIRGLVVDSLKEELGACIEICERSPNREEAANRIRERKRKLR